MYVQNNNKQRGKDDIELWWEGYIYGADGYVL